MLKVWFTDGMKNFGQKSEFNDKISENPWPDDIADEGWQTDPNHFIL